MRAMSWAGTRRLSSSLAALVVGSAAAHCQLYGGLQGVARFGRLCGGLPTRGQIAAGEVERRQSGFRVLRQAAPTGLDEARNRPVTARGASLAQHRGAAAQLARQYDEGAVDVDPRAVDHDG